MPDFLAAPIDQSLPPPLAVLVRLIVALVCGVVVAFVYRRTRAANEIVPSFTTTLVLLAILIAMVTQVIGDNVARAFSLVGALSIVRFRTIVRDTQDTAFVIFAVAVGMAVGASHPWVAVCGLGVVSLAAFVMRGRNHVLPPVLLPGELPFSLAVRVGLGHEVNGLLDPTLDRFLRERQLAAVMTAKQGMAIEVTYRMALQREDAASELVASLNRLEGVQGVTLERVMTEDV
jgi:hypothetical protein